MKEYKIIFTGTMGAGKTTAINAVSQIKPVTTDVINNDPTSLKEMTTVGLDYGEISLGTNERLRLYGTPGQDRFSFMWKVLSQGALGLIILIDSSTTDPFKDISIYLKHFKDLITQTACVIGISKVDSNPHIDIDRFSNIISEHGILCPVVPVDTRDKTQVLWVLDLLLTQLEARS